MVVVKQFRYYGNANHPRQDWKDNNLFENINKQGGEVIKLGIQAPPGTPFYLNCTDTSGNEILVGSTSIYELDVDGFTTLSSLTFGRNPLGNKAGASIIVDVVYRILEG